jgi:hypothetical protein
MTTQNAAVQFDQATALDATGKTEAASATYLALLTLVPDHAGALNNYGALLCRTGYRSAARTVFAQAAACHPEQPAGHVNLANLLREDGELDAAERHYTAALAGSPGCAEAHQGLGNVFADRGDPARAAEHRRLGWQGHVFTPWRYRGAGQPVRVLLLTSVGGGNVPVRHLLDDMVFAVTAVAMEFFQPAMALPPHDLVFNAIGDADACGLALAAAALLVTAKPILNAPRSVAATARVSNAERLRGGPGLRAPHMPTVRAPHMPTVRAPHMPTVRTPHMATVPRHALADPAALTSLGFRFPLLLRAPGFHTGQHFIRVDQPADLAAAAALPGDDVLAIEILPAQGLDGMARKYRVMIVGGRLYPLHLAISADWKVHYFTAAMAANPAFRAEEAKFLADMTGCLGRRACAALAWIADTLALDYAGVDFALDADGTVLLFEANATMALVPPPPEPMWDYRRPAFDTVMAAARTLVSTAAGTGAHRCAPGLTTHRG